MTATFTKTSPNQPQLYTDTKEETAEPNQAVAKMLKTTSNRAKKALRAGLASAWKVTFLLTIKARE